MVGRALVVLLLTPLTVRGQIATDRPDFVESSATVGAGGVQLELSVAHARDGGMRGWSTPSLLRVGLGDRFELRAESELLVRERVAGESTSGIADASVGAKWAASDGVALLLHADLPTGSEKWRGEGVRPSLRVVIERDLPSGFGIGVMPGVLRDDGPGGGYTAALLGVVLGKALTDRFRTFVELGLERIARDGDGGTAGSWNAGAALLLSAESQLDAAVSVGATSSSTPFSITVGYSRRFGPSVTP